ncbi:MAG TPA: HAD hydrolase-like protein [Planctomycetota bacterium]|nr:HAD hydrolase-like protein [Planctomycetota bacterium]
MSRKRKNPPLTVVLDFFGVLVQEGMSVSHNLYQMVQPRLAYEPMWASYMRLAVGRETNESFWRYVAPPKSDWRAFERRFFDSLTPEPELPAIIAGFRKLGARLAILSEIPDAWMGPMLRRLGVTGRFDVIVTSGRAGATKPEPAIFELLMRELGPVRPGERRFYVDDRLNNLAAGERYGLTGIWMRRGASPVSSYRPRHTIVSLAEGLRVVRAAVEGPASFDDARDAVLGELARALREVDARSAQRLAEMILAAPRVFVYGRGRTGLATWAFASRLAQLGLETHVVGEMTAPAISRGDLLVVASGTGTTRTTLLAAGAARKIGARVAALTAHPKSPLGKAAELVVTVAGATRRRLTNEAKSAQYGGSLFEQTLLLTLDAVAMVLKQGLARTDQEMDRRHANLE